MFHIFSQWFVSALVQGSGTDPNLLTDPDSEEADGVERENSSDVAVYVCEYLDCGRSFQYRRNLYRHQRQVHGALFGAAQQVAFFCSVQNCRRTFYCMTTLAKHQRNVHGFVTNDIPWLDPLYLPLAVNLLMLRVYFTLRKIFCYVVVLTDRGGNSVITGVVGELVLGRNWFWLKFFTCMWVILLIFIWKSFSSHVSKATSVTCR